MVERKQESHSLNKKIGIPLLLWGWLNAGIGLLFLVVPSDVWKGLLVQSFFWGLIDGGLGVLAFVGKKQQPLMKLKKTFLVNAYLDVGYMIAGICIIMFWGIDLGLGTGIGIIIQGAFLLVVDAHHHEHVKALITRTGEKTAEGKKHGE